MSDLIAMVKAGRCANGSERDKGRVTHAVERYSLSGPALCGTKPGRHSAGWTDLPAHVEVSCPRCLKRMASLDRIEGDEG